MMPVHVTVQKWGNSLGFRIPKDVAKREKLTPKKHVDILILKDNSNMDNMFGKFKGAFNKPTQEIMDELRKELYDE